MDADRLIELITPVAPVPAATAPAGRRDTAEHGLRIGILDNSKANADLLLSLLEQGLRRELAIDNALTLRKRNPSRGAPADILDRLAAETDLVFTAMAD